MFGGLNEVMYMCLNIIGTQYMVAGCYYRYNHHHLVISVFEYHTGLYRACYINGLGDTFQELLSWLCDDSITVDNLISPCLLSTVAVAVSKRNMVYKDPGLWSRADLDLSLHQQSLAVHLGQDA